MRSPPPPCIPCSWSSATCRDARAAPRRAGDRPSLGRCRARGCERVALAAVGCRRVWRCRMSTRLRSPELVLAGRGCIRGIPGDASVGVPGRAWRDLSASWFHGWRRSAPDSPPFAADRGLSRPPEHRSESMAVRTIASILQSVDWRGARCGLLRHPPRSGRPVLVQTCAPTMYFCVPDYDVPSGGVRVTYRHVDPANGAAYRRRAMHRAATSAAAGLRIETPGGREPGDGNRARDDLVVVGELAISLLDQLPSGTRFVVFNQNPHLTWQRVPERTLADTPHAPTSRRWSWYRTHSRQMVQYAAPSANVVASPQQHRSPSVLFRREPPERVRVHAPRRTGAGRVQVFAMLSGRGMLDGWEIVALHGLTEAEVAAAPEIHRDLCQLRAPRGLRPSRRRSDGLRSLRGRLPWLRGPGISPARVQQPGRARATSLDLPAQSSR